VHSWLYILIKNPIMIEEEKELPARKEAVSHGHFDEFI